MKTSKNVTTDERKTDRAIRTAAMLLLGTIGFLTLIMIPDDEHFFSGLLLSKGIAALSFWASYRIYKSIEPWED